MRITSGCSSSRKSRSIIGKHDRWDGWRYHWRQRYRSLVSKYTEKMLEYWLKNDTGSLWHCDEKLFLKHVVPQHRKDRNSSRKRTASLIRHQNHNAEVVDRSWRCFSPSQACVYCFTCRLLWADTTECEHSLIRKVIFDWKHALELLRSHEHSMEHVDVPRLCLVADVINRYKELMQN